MKFDELKTKQQEYIRNLYDGIVRTFETAGQEVQILDAYPRQRLKMMSMNYCDMKWAPAWIVKDKSRQVDKGSYAIPELKEYHQMRLRDELPTDDGETIIVGTEVVAA